MRDARRLMLSFCKSLLVCLTGTHRFVSLEFFSENVLPVVQKWLYRPIVRNCELLIELRLLRLLVSTF